MADLYVKQAKEYADARPTYPPELFEFIVSKTPARDLAWDVGTGSGQAITPLAKTYKKVIGTDTTAKQLKLAPEFDNVSYFDTPPTMSIDELQTNTNISESSVDLVTVAEALHWMDLSNFYAQVKWALKKPNGILAAWCYTPNPKVDDTVDAVFGPLYRSSGPYWEDGKKLIDDRYESIEFPFEPVDGLDRTGPFDFVAGKEMKLEDYLTYIRSWSAYNIAKDKGVELLTEEVVEKFKNAWNKSESGEVGGEKVVKFPIYLRLGKINHV